MAYVQECRTCRKSLAATVNKKDPVQLMDGSFLFLYYCKSRLNLLRYRNRLKGVSEQEQQQQERVVYDHKQGSPNIITLGLPCYPIAVAAQRIIALKMRIIHTADWDIEF